jgi:DNA-binding HxlR family transcriptional regulator
MRFSELERAVDGISQRILIRQLKGLEEDGLGQRTAYPEVPPRVEYALSDVGYALEPAIDALVTRAGLLSKRKHARGWYSFRPQRIAQ